MTRRPRSSFGFSRAGALRAPLLGLAAALGLTAAACSSDLFHSTEWQSRCDLDPDASICPQGTGGASGSSTTSDASSGESSSASTTSGAGGSGGGGSSSASTTGAATAAASSSTG